MVKGMYFYHKRNIVEIMTENSDNFKSKYLKKNKDKSKKIIILSLFFVFSICGALLRINNAEAYESTEIYKASDFSLGFIQPNTEIDDVIRCYGKPDITKRDNGITLIYGKSFKIHFSNQIGMDMIESTAHNGIKTAAGIQVGDHIYKVYSSYNVYRNDNNMIEIMELLDCDMCVLCYYYNYDKVITKIVFNKYHVDLDEYYDD